MMSPDPPAPCLPRAHAVPPAVNVRLAYAGTDGGGDLLGMLTALSPVEAAAGMPPPALLTALLRDAAVVMNFDSNGNATSYGTGVLASAPNVTAALAYLAPLDDAWAVRCAAASDAGGDTAAAACHGGDTSIASGWRSRNGASWRLPRTAPETQPTVVLTLRDVQGNARGDAGGSTVWAVLAPAGEEAAAGGNSLVRHVVRFGARAAAGSGGGTVGGWEGAGDGGPGTSARRGPPPPAEGAGIGMSTVRAACAALPAGDTPTCAGSTPMHTGVVGTPCAFAGTALRVWGLDARNGSLLLPLPALTPVVVSRVRGAGVSAADECGALPPTTTTAAAAVRAATMGLLLPDAGVGVDLTLDPALPALAAEAVAGAPLGNRTAAAGQAWEVVGELRRTCSPRMPPDANAAAGAVDAPCGDAAAHVAASMTLEVAAPATRRTGAPLSIHVYMPASPASGSGLVARWWSDGRGMASGAGVGTVLAARAAALDVGDLWGGDVPTVAGVALPLPSRGWAAKWAAATTFAATGFLLAPVDATYTFTLAAAGGTPPAVELQIDGIVVIFATTAAGEGDGDARNVTGTITLRGPQLYRLVVSALRPRSTAPAPQHTTLRLLWRWSAGVAAPNDDDFTVPGAAGCSWRRVAGEAGDCAWERAHLRTTALQYRNQVADALVPPEALWPDDALAPVAGSPLPLLLQMQGGVGGGGWGGGGGGGVSHFTGGVGAVALVCFCCALLASAQ